MQLGLALWLNPRLILPLVLVWAYMLLMTKEFFAATRLKSHLRKHSGAEFRSRKLRDGPYRIEAIRREEIKREIERIVAYIKRRVLRRI